LNRRRFMDDARIIEQQQRPGLLHGETDSRRSVCIEHPGLAAPDVLTSHQQKCDEINSVTMRAFRSRPANAIGRVNPELMRLYVPTLHAADPGNERADGGE